MYERKTEAVIENIFFSRHFWPVKSSRSVGRQEKIAGFFKKNGPCT